MDFGGDGYEQDVEFHVVDPINGLPAAGIAYVQPQTAILTKEEASLYPEDSPFYAQYLQVARVYETIPGPTFYETSLDIDGATLTTATTRKLCSDITTGEAINGGVWCKTTKKPTDIDVICEEVVACRVVPGNPMESTSFADDGTTVVTFQTMKDTTTIVPGGNFNGGFLELTSIKDIDGTNLVSWEIFESSEVPGAVLEGTEVDPRTGIAIEIEKQIVPAGAIGGVSGGVYTDVKSIDKWRSITIASSLDPDTLPSPVQWETTEGHSFPNTLLGATWLWAAASSDCCFSFDLALETQILEGYSGPCRSRVTESFTDGPPGDVVTITQFFPQGYTLGYAWAIAEGGDGCRLCQAQARTFGIPSTLHDEITIAGGVILVNGTFTSTIPATDPIGLPAPGTLITKSVDVERWRFGIFYRRITEIYVPG